ncbi:hypothetical protein ASZ78_011424 [Callipepla squamata]|uniref:Small monomeric GTPase n=1 Tax=Callipepla squamata TaxID=9009 RepID=A0A226MLS1_CALSU|nr:hypothetical protein ASZ78_011424 [Callipepla squamata]
MDGTGITVKLILIGDSAVGKSSLLLRFAEGSFEPSLKPTICEPGEAGMGLGERGDGGVDFKVKKMVVDGHTVQLAIWDTAGQERFRSLNPSYYRGTQGIVLAPFLPLPVYDVTRKDTFTGLENWLNELEIYTTKSNTVKMLVGNKTDKPDREVERREGLQFAKKRSLLFIETSAKTEDGVQHAFEELVIKILQTPNLLDKSTKKEGVQLKESTQQGKSLCAAYCPLS